MIHLCGFHGNLKWTNNQRQQIPALPDTALFTQGGNLRIPKGMGTVLATAAITYQTSAVSCIASLESPYLLRRAPHYIRPLNDAGVWGYLGGFVMAKPSMMLAPEESVRAWWTGSPAASTPMATNVLMWIADAVPQPITSGELMTVRGVTSATITGGAWATATLTFDRELPYGDYRVIGMRVEGANVTAGRLVLPGTPWRPGVVAMQSDFLGPREFRGGMMGELARFNSNQPPSMELLTTSNVAAIVHLDLVPM